MNIKSVRITKCSNSELWYWGKEGQTFKYSHSVMNKRYSYEKAEWEDVRAFVVDNGSPHSVIVNKDDCRLVLG